MGDKPLSTTLHLTVATGVHPTRILRDIRSGVIEANRYGRDYLFTPEQFLAARDHYKSRKGTKRNAGKRTEPTDRSASHG